MHVVGSIVPVADHPVAEVVLLSGIDSREHHNPDDEGCWHSADDTVAIVRTTAYHHRHGQAVMAAHDFAQRAGHRRANGDAYHYRRIGRKLASRGSRFLTTHESVIVAKTLAVGRDDTPRSSRGMCALTADDPGA